MSLYCVLIVCAVISAVSCQGSCPPALSVDVCEAACGPEAPCGGSQLCCPTVCGGNICVDPVTQRKFTYLVKPGNCPAYPRGPWLCSSMCTGDSDCPRKLKCCPNRCQALVCQKPDYDEQPLFVW